MKVLKYLDRIPILLKIQIRSDLMMPTIYDDKTEPDFAMSSLKRVLNKNKYGGCISIKL